MFAVLLMVVILVVVVAEYLVKTNRHGVAKGDLVFDGFLYFVYALFLPGCLVGLFVTEAIFDTLGVREAVSSYAYWLIGGLVMALLTVTLHGVVRLRR
jgi:Na+-driven multidrug efflux pump